MEKYILSCDWGSTSFRLRLVDLADQHIIGEIFSDDGITRTFNTWKTSIADRGISRKQFFLDHLKKQTDMLAGKLSINFNDITIVISGMASSSIGMQEMPYALLPFALNGSQASLQLFDSQDNFPNRVILISGVKNSEEVVRGEETQLVGLTSLLNLMEQEAVLILPGTHSKHLHIQNGRLVNIQTFMTGELYSLLINHSILKDSIDVNTAELSEADADAFKQGISKSFSSNILNNLFTVRTNQLFNKLTKRQNALYLSGLLIGTELNHLPQMGDLPFILCSGSNLFELYKLALQELNLLKRATIASVDMINKATIAGQIIIAQKHTEQLTKTA